MKTNHRTRVTLVVVAIALFGAAAISSAAPPASGRSVAFAGLAADDSAGVQDPLHEAGLLYDQAVKLTAAVPANSEFFGYAVAIDGDTIVVGAYGADGGAGAAYILERNWGGGADVWGQVTRLTAPVPAAGDNFGLSVAISGDTVVVGAPEKPVLFGSSDPGAAYVFERNQDGADNWGQVATLAPAAPALNDRFGYSVGISVDTVVVGAYGDGGSGSATLFQRNQGGAEGWGQVKKLTASGAAEGDSFGIAVSISLDTILVGAPEVDGGGADRGAAYLFERNQGAADNWGQVKKLTASIPADDDHFGRSVAIDTDTCIVGAYGDGGSTGAAYLFERNQNGADDWGQVSKLTASDAESSDYFGWSVAVHGDSAVVGAQGEDGAGGNNRGAAYLFERNQGGGTDGWGEASKLTASDAQDGDSLGISVAIGVGRVLVGAYLEDGAGTNRGAAYLYVDDGRTWQEVARPRAGDGVTDDRFGLSAAVSGDTLVVGAPEKDGGDGAAYLFTRNEEGADGWGEVTKLPGSEDYARFGSSVGISGDTVIVGAPEEDGQIGAAYLFERNQNGADDWGQVARLAPAIANDHGNFGCAVAISGDTAVVGAKYAAAGDGGSSRGVALVFSRNQGGADAWGQVARLTASDAADNDYFGYSIAISGDTVLVGAWANDDAGTLSGSAYLFGRNQGGPDAWGEVEKLVATDAAAEDRFGISVAISGDRAVVGAHSKDVSADHCGAVYLFERNRGGMDEWNQVTRLTASDAANTDYFGSSVGISGATIVIGAMYDDDNGNSSGSAYVLERNQGGADDWGEVTKLTASNGEGGDNFGAAVSISDESILVGAHGESAGRGLAYLFRLESIRVFLPLVISNS